MQRARLVCCTVLSLHLLGLGGCGGGGGGDADADLDDGGPGDADGIDDGDVTEDADLADDGGGDADVADDGGGDADAESPPSRIYVTLVSHNEDTATGDNEDCQDFLDAIATRYEPNRQALLDIAAIVDAHGAAWNFQSDIQYVNLVLEREPVEDNILRELAEWPSGRVSVDAHAHESRWKNYADVANRLDEASGARNGIVGGFTAVVCEGERPPFNTWERFREPLEPVDEGPAWVATILTDGASPGHPCDPSASGVWRPASFEDFFIDDPDQELVNVGTGLAGHGLVDGLAALETLVDDFRAGRLEEGSLYTSNVTIPQCNFDLPDRGVTPSDIEAFIEAVDDLDGGDDIIRWATFSEIVEIWREEYGARPSLWRGVE